jgi:hypothetical protein
VRGMILGGAYKKFGSAFVNILRHEFWPESTMLSLLALSRDLVEIVTTLRNRGTYSKRLNKANKVVLKFAFGRDLQGISTIT